MLIYAVKMFDVSTIFLIANLVQSICFCAVVHVRVISPFHFV